MSLVYSAFFGVIDSEFLGILKNAALRFPGFSTITTYTAACFLHQRVAAPNFSGVCAWVHRKVYVLFTSTIKRSLPKWATRSFNSGWYVPTSLGIERILLLSTSSKTFRRSVGRIGVFLTQAFALRRSFMLLNTFVGPHKITCSGAVDSGIQLELFNRWGFRPPSALEKMLRAGDD
jgi:hypothetical protein